MRRLASSHHRRFWWVMVICVLILGLLVLVGPAWLKLELRQHLLAAAEPGSSLGEVSLSLTGITLNDVRLQAPHGWPQAEILVAPVIFLAPVWTSLWSKHPRLRTVQLRGARLSLRRTAERRLELLPGLTAGTSARAVEQLRIDTLTLTDSSLDIYDAAVAAPPKRLRLSEAQVQLQNLQLPVADVRSSIAITARLPGSPAGYVQVSGWSNFGSRQSSLQTTLRAVDLRVIEPYLLKAESTGFAGGTLDLQLNSQVQDGQMVAPGHISLSNLKLASEGIAESLLKLPRAAVVAALTDKNQRIELDFTLHGQPGQKAELRLNEPVLKQLALVAAEGLGLSLQGIALGLGEIGQTSVKTVGYVFGFVLNGGGLLSADNSTK